MKPLKESFIKAKDLNKMRTNSLSSFNDLKFGDIVAIRTEWSDDNYIYLQGNIANLFMRYDFKRKEIIRLDADHFKIDFPNHDEAHNVKILGLIGHYDDYESIKGLKKLKEVLEIYK